MLAKSQNWDLKKLKIKKLKKTPLPLSIQGFKLWTMNAPIVCFIAEKKHGSWNMLKHNQINSSIHPISAGVHKNPGFYMLTIAVVVID